jgi:hypothetical protein
VALSYNQFFSPYTNFYSYANVSGFGGLVVSMLASGTQDRGLEPSRSRRIFRAKKSTACLLSHVAALRHVKKPCDLRGSRNRRQN